MKKIIQCAYCGSDDVNPDPIAQRIAIGVCGLTGVILACVCTKNVKKSGILAGFFTGSTIGQTIGTHLDKHVLCFYKCETCGHRFRP